MERVYQTARVKYPPVGVKKHSAGTEKQRCPTRMPFMIQGDPFGPYVQELMADAYGLLEQQRIEGIPDDVIQHIAALLCD